MPATVLSNGNARWATFVLVLLSALVGVIMYVTDVRADVNQNAQQIIRVEKNCASMNQAVQRMERRQLFMMQYAGVKKSDIPD